MRACVGRRTIHTSSDSGASWQFARVVHAGPAGYSVLTPLPELGEKAVGVLYEHEEPGSAQYWNQSIGDIAFKVVDLAGGARGGWR